METWMFTIDEPLPAAWRACIERFPPQRCDVYMHPAYCAPWLRWEGGSAVALWDQIEGIECLYCVLVKPLPEPVDEHWRYDAQSFYGYGGIITSAPAPPAVLDRFNDAVDAWMQQHGVVVEFVRQHPQLHPVAQQARRAEYRLVRTNVYAEPPSAALAALDAATRRNIAKAHRNGIRIEQWSASHGAEIFSRLYQRTAARLQMDAFYHFPREYFVETAELLGDRVWYLVALLEETPIAALMVIESGTALTYHLGASDEQYWSLRPNDALFAHLLQIASHQRNNRTVSLGGGTSADPNDSLYRYKSKFGNQHRPVYIGARIHQPQVYQQLCHQWETANPERAAQYRHYVLRYRIGEFDHRLVVQ